MSTVDLALVILLLLFAVRGYWRGLLREGCALAGLLGGAVAAGAMGPAVAALIVSRGGAAPVPAALMGAAAVFLGVYFSAVVAGLVLDRLARAVFLGGLNRMAGVAFGLAKGATVLGLGLVVLQRVVPRPGLGDLIEASKLGRPLTTFASVVVEAGMKLIQPAAATTPV